MYSQNTLTQHDNIISEALRYHNKINRYNTIYTDDVIHSMS